MSLFAASLHESKQVLQVGHTHQSTGRRKGLFFEAYHDHRLLLMLTCAGTVPQISMPVPASSVKTNRRARAKLLFSSRLES